MYVQIRKEEMKHSDFKIGSFFYTGSGLWKCTDVGTRTICAIKIDEKLDFKEEPPYSVEEVVFDEYDFEGCILSGAKKCKEL